MRRFLSDSLLSSPYDAARYSYDRVPPPPLESWDFQRMVVGPLKDFLAGVLAFIPDILIALCIILAGWVAGRIAQLIVSCFLKSVKFDVFAKKMGLSALLESDSDKTPPHRWFGLLTFWVVMFVSFVFALDRLRLRIASIQLDRLFHFVILIVTVLVIFSIGMFLSLLCSKLIRVFAQSLKVEKPDLYAGVARWIILIFTLLACLMQIGFPNDLLLGVMVITFITVCISFILAFGLGGRVWAGRMLEKLSR